jgi:hypothetical protein
VGVPARAVESLTPAEKAELDFEHGNLPDPLSDVVKMILQLQTKLDERVKRLERLSEEE